MPYNNYLPSIRHYKQSRQHFKCKGGLHSYMQIPCHFI
jgi:hypothetical protein